MQDEAELAHYGKVGFTTGRSWLLRARVGLCQLLRARVAPAQRQATLQLCAAVSAVGGPHWLLASSRNVVSFHVYIVKEQHHARKGRSLHASSTGLSLTCEIWCDHER